MVPDCAPRAVAVGVKVTLRVQDVLAAMDAQPLAANSGLELGKVIVIAAAVLFLMVNVLAALVEPCVTLPRARVAGVMVTGLTPVPVRFEVNILPTAPVTEMVPVAAPAAVGLNETPTVHVELAGAKPAQVPVFVCTKGAATAIVTGTAVVDEFFTVNENGLLGTPSPTLPNPCVAGVSVMGLVPVPVTVMVCGVVVALSATTKLPVCVPIPVGVKVIVILQFLPAATDGTHVSVSVKGPLGVMLVTVSAVVLLVLDSVTLLVLLFDPTATDPNVTEVDESVAVCACAPLATPPIKIRQRNRRMRKRKLLVMLSLTSFRGIFFKQTKWLPVASGTCRQQKLLRQSPSYFLACTLRAPAKPHKKQKVTDAKGMESPELKNLHATLTLEGLWLSGPSQTSMRRNHRGVLRQKYGLDDEKSGLVPGKSYLPPGVERAATLD